MSPVTCGTHRTETVPFLTELGGHPRVTVSDHLRSAAHPPCTILVVRHFLGHCAFIT